ncbi:MAG TPA: hypothetical protein VML55_02055 [Planctomycetaceae bacterium]|nr:hypothetical protein [Planctomycetaceae bacterium]
MSIARETTGRVEADAGQAGGMRGLLEAEPPAMIAKSIAAFRRELPELLKTHRGQWVAYHGDERVGFGRRQTPLYQECLRRGWSRDEFIVWGIEPCALDEEFEATPDV